MIDSIPTSAADLGFNLKMYEELARNIGRMNSISPQNRENILNRADKKLNKDIGTKVKRLINDLVNDRQVYELAELPYHKGPPENKGLFITAVAEYLLTHRIELGLSS